jgi:2'-5' RNA ligase
VADTQPDYTGSCMIALYPPPAAAEKLAVADGLDADSMHVTIAYTGDAADVDPKALKAVAKALADRPPFTAAISGHARFTGGEKDVIVALVDAPELETLRADARKALDEAGIAIPSEHGFTAHMSIRYCGQDDADPVGRLAAFPVEFGAVSAVHGKKRTDYPFADPLAERAREAYAAGWALSDGPMTDRVKAGCAAAVAHATENRDDSGILEVSLHLGKLTGTWAEVYRRRDELTAGHVAKVTAIWRKLAKKLAARALAEKYRREQMIPAAESDQDAARRKAEARDAALAWLLTILSDPEYADLEQAIATALAAAQAEGSTAALAVAADQAAAYGFDWARAYDAMLAGVAYLEKQPGIADATVQEVLGGASADVGRILADMATSGATDAQVAAEVEAAIAGEDVRAVTAAVDNSMWSGFAQATLGLYQAEGLDLADWLTAGDDRVCPVCQDNEDNGPYAPADFPALPAHPRCRCCSSPATPLAFSAFAAFLIPTD